MELPGASPLPAYHLFFRALSRFNTHDHQPPTHTRSSTGILILESLSGFCKDILLCPALLWLQSMEYLPSLGLYLFLGCLSPRVMLFIPLALNTTHIPMTPRLERSSLLLLEPVLKSEFLPLLASTTSILYLPSEHYLHHSFLSAIRNTCLLKVHSH